MPLMVTYLRPRTHLETHELQTRLKTPAYEKVSSVTAIEIAPLLSAPKGKSEPSRREMAESGDAGVQMMVHGISAPIYSQSPTAVQQRLNPSKTPPKTTKTNRPGAPGKISKIRNYNAKD